MPIGPLMKQSWRPKTCEQSEVIPQTAGGRHTEFPPLVGVGPHCAATTVEISATVSVPVQHCAALVQGLPIGVQQRSVDVLGPPQMSFPLQQGDR